MSTAWKPEDAINALMDRFARRCVRIHRPFPPPCTRSGRSKLGGLPNLPPDIEWPYGRSRHRSSPTSTPLQFLAQIDCSELPRCGDLLPLSGMLYFFANTSDWGAWDGHQPDDFRRVLYAPRVGADQAVRRPPVDMPDVSCHKGVGGVYPRGYSFAHQPNDPLTGKVYFEWPVQFVVTDSYPDADAVCKSPAWVGLAADWNARAEADESFRDEYGDETVLLDMYSEARSERMLRALCAALNVAEPPRSVAQDRAPKTWRRIGAGLAFPPTAAFASEISAAIDYFMDDQIAEAEHARGLGASPQPLPDWTEDVRIVKQEAAGWLQRVRALPADHVLDAQMRERFLAWLDELEDRNWARIPGHTPRIFNGVRYPFGKAMFQLARLAASQDVIRSHFPDALFAHDLFSQGGAHYHHHQMLGWFGSSQQPQPMSEPLVHLLQLSYDDLPDFRFGDVGEMQFFMTERDLKAKNFNRVQAQMQGG